jgi:hypothetical protein
VIYFTEDGSDPTSSKDRQRLNPGDTVTIRGTRKVRLTVSDEKGNYGAVQTYEAIDDLEKSIIKRPQQRPALIDEMISFVFPKTKEAAQITIASLIQEISESKLFSEDELKKVVQNALDSLNK